MLQACRKVRRTLILGTILGVCLGSISAQNRNTITGFVFDQQRNPVTQASVEVTNEVNQVLQRTKTDGTGKYFFSSLSAGRFTIRVLPFGTNFEEQSQEVEIINFVRPGSSTSENAQKDFYLRLRRVNSPGRFLTGTVFAQEVPAEARKLYEKAISDFESRSNETAMHALLDAVKIFPDYYLAIKRLGLEYIKLQKFDYAQAAYLKAVSINQKSFNGWYGLAYSAYALKKSGMAVEAAQKAAELDPSSVDAALLVGISHRQIKNYSDAEKSLLRAKKLVRGETPDVHWNLALLYANDLRRFREAADELELYLKAKPDAENAEQVKKLITEFRQKAASAS